MGQQQSNHEQDATMQAEEDVPIQDDGKFELYRQMHIHVLKFLFQDLTAETFITNLLNEHYQPRRRIIRTCFSFVTVLYIFF